jgi:hypothetical protein
MTAESPIPNAPEQQSEFRPGQPIPERETPWNFFITSFVLAICVYWVLIPIWPHINTHILGDPETDAIRGMWGFDHIRRSIIPPQTPVWSNLINFPAGALFLPLPWTTSIILAPLGILFGPFVAWNLGIAVMLWAFGMSTAWMVRTLTQSWAAGLLIGSFVISQPLLLHAIGDGTLEHIALWTVPLFLGSAWKGIQNHSAKWSLFAGCIALLLALDSPYHAIYTAVSSMFILPFAFFRRWSPTQRIELAWSLATLIITAVIGALILLILYQSFPIKSATGADKIGLLKMNAADARNWWQHDSLNVFVRDSSLAPTLIPSFLLLIAVLLIFVGIPNSLPWFFAGLLMLTLSMGLNGRLPLHLGQWMGGFGQWLGEFVMDTNRRLYAFPGIGQIRFPMRWLIPSSLMFFVGASYGLKRLYNLKHIRKYAFLCSTIFALLGLIVSLQSSRIDIGFPMHKLPEVQFAEWIKDQEGAGAVLLLPQMRPPPKSGKREDLPVFANISQLLSSADAQYFQVIHGRPMYTKPSLKTLSAADQQDIVARLVRNWDDMAHPMLTGNEIPPSAYDPRSANTRQAAFQTLVASGLRFIAVDLGAYNDEAQTILREQIQDRVEKEIRFEEGDGVLVFELR